MKVGDVQVAHGSEQQRLRGEEIVFLANAFEDDAPTRLLLEVAVAVQRAGAVCEFWGWSRSGQLEQVIARRLGSRPVLLAERAAPLGAGVFCELRARLRARPPRLFHIILTRPSILAPPAVRHWAPAAKIIVTQHGIHEWSESPYPPAIVRRAFGLAARSVDRMVAVSEAVARDLRDAAVVPNDRLVVIHNGVDCQRYSPDARAARGRVLTKLFPGTSVEDVILIGAAGNLKFIKGYDLFIEAAASLSPRLPFLRFVIWGEGPERPALERRIRELSLGAVFRLPGRASNLPECLAACDCFVQPSRSESFGLAVAEAMASGVPVVATAVGGLVELVTDGECGLLVPPESSHALALTLEYLVEHSDLRKRLGEAARHRIEKAFTLERMVSRHLKLYAELLQED